MLQHFAHPEDAEVSSQKYIAMLSSQLRTYNGASNTSLAWRSPRSHADSVAGSDEDAGGAEAGSGGSITGGPIYSRWNSDYYNSRHNVGKQHLTCHSSQNRSLQRPVFTLCTEKKETKCFFCNISYKTWAMLTKLGTPFGVSSINLLQSDVNVCHITWSQVSTVPCKTW